MSHPLLASRTRVSRRLALSFLMLVASLVVTANVDAQRKKKKGATNERWPFGIQVVEGVRTSTMDRRDLFNLGLIGAKAWDADRPEPKKRTGGGKRSFKSSRNKGGDIGPKRLSVRALLGGAPGQKAGLKIGDLILGVDQSTFEKGCYQPIADSLRRAETGSGLLTLKVQRGDEIFDLNVKIPKRGKDFANLVAGKAQTKILQKTLKWLAERQLDTGGYPQTLGGANGSVVMTCLAGMAWIAGGSTLRGGKHKKNLQSALTFVQTELFAKDPFAGQRNTKANWNQSTWAYTHAVIFFGELMLVAKNKKLKAFTQKLIDEVCARQEISGGYAHGPGGKNALEYLELNILGGYTMLALSLAKQAGCKIDQKVADHLMAYLEKSAGEDGGVGYSAGKGQQGHGNIGRTAGAWLGAAGIGQRGQPFVKKMKTFTSEHIAEHMKGHASLMQHILLGGVAARAIGGDVEGKYWKTMLRDFVLARSPDGSFQMRPWHESLGMSSNSDVSMGEIWSTASWAIVLGANQFKGKKGGLRGLCARDVQ